MNDDAPFVFALSDVVDGVEISPAAVPIGLLTKFSKDVYKLISGSQDLAAADTVMISIESGSLALAVPSASVNVSFARGLQQVAADHHVHHLAASSADVLVKWQRAARRHPDRRFAVYRGTGPLKTVLLKISKDTRLSARNGSAWVESEHYLHGMVMDSGGSSAVNIHLKIGDKTICVSATPEQIGRQEKNHVFHEVLLRVIAEENLDSGELRNYKLVDFVDYEPKFDASAFEQLTGKGGAAWKDVPDLSEWLQSIRGG